MSASDVDRIKRSLLTNATTTSTTTTTTTTAAATTTTDVSAAASSNATSSLDGPVLAAVAPGSDGALMTSSTPGHVSSQTVALDVDDAAAVDELLTAYRESLRVQGELAVHDSTTDCCSLMPAQLRSHSAASSISDLVNVAELSVRRVIAMAKQVSSHSHQPRLILPQTWFL